MEGKAKTQGRIIMTTGHHTWPVNHLVTSAVLSLWLMTQILLHSFIYLCGCRASKAKRGSTVPSIVARGTEQPWAEWSDHTLWATYTGLREKQRESGSLWLVFKEQRTSSVWWPRVDVRVDVREPLELFSTVPLSSWWRFLVSCRWDTVSSIPVSVCAIKSSAFLSSVQMMNRLVCLTSQSQLTAL